MTGSNILGINRIKETISHIPRDLTWTSFFTGLLVVLVSCTGPAALLLQAAQAGNFTYSQTLSWLTITWLGSGLVGLILTLRYQMPIFGASSSTSVAFLITALNHIDIKEVVGAYYLAAILLLIISYAGWFEKIMTFIPRPIVMAMLGGVLFQFGVKGFAALSSNAVLVIGMTLFYFVVQLLKWRGPVLWVTLGGAAIVLLQGKFQANKLEFGHTTLVWINPHFSLSTLIEVAIPLLLITLSTQFAPGFAVLMANDFKPPIKSILSVSGFLSLFSASTLNSGLNCAAISAAIGVGPQAEPDRNRRYTGAVMAGIFYIIVGIFAKTALSLFQAAPMVFISILTCIALLPAIANSTYEALKSDEYRETAMVTFLVTTSGVRLLNIGAPFWGLCAGMIINQILKINLNNSVKN